MEKAVDYRFHRPKTTEDVEQVYGLMNAVFGDEGVDTIIKNLLDHYPETKLNHLTAVKHGDETAAALIMIPQTWMLDGVEIKVAEMGCVGTHPEHRRKGLQNIPPTTVHVIHID